jgi:hypothetical protein
LAEPWSISGTTGVFYLTENSQRRPQGECQIEVEQEIGKSDVFFEYQGFHGAPPTTRRKSAEATSSGPTSASTIL